jgi:hypothetical protein
MRSSYPSFRSGVRALVPVFAALLLSHAAHGQITFRASSSALNEGVGVQHRATGTSASGTGASITPGLPTRQAGDLLVLAIEARDLNTISVPNWTLLTNPVGTQGANHQAAIYWRIATNTAADTATVSRGSTVARDVIFAQISAFANVNTVNPFDGVYSFGASTGAANTVSTGAITTANPCALLVSTVHIADNNGFTSIAPGTWYQSFYSTTSTGSDAAIGLWYRNATTTGAQASVTITHSANDFAHAAQFAIEPGGLTVSVPAGTQAGDVMVATVASRPDNTTATNNNAKTVCAPAGWTLVRDTINNSGGGSGGGGLRLQTWTRVATGAEPASYTWFFQINNPSLVPGTGGGEVFASASVGIVSYSGVDNTTLVDVEGGNTTASSYNHTGNSIITTVANTLLVANHTFLSADTWTAPGGMTERVDQSAPASPPGNAVGIALEMSDEPRPTAGATGARTAVAGGTSNADNGIVHMLALRPGALNHLSISHTGSGVACEDQTITFTAHNAAHSAVNANGLAVTLSTSNGRGTWTGIVVGGGVLSDPTPGDGAATYTFAAGSTSVSLSFRYADLAVTSETFSFNISGGGFSETTGTATAADDPSFTMAQAGFQFRNITDGTTLITSQIAGKPSDVGFNAKVTRLRAIRTDTATGSCTGLFASQARTVQLGAECNNPTTCAGQQASINGSSIATSNDNGGAGAAAYTGVSLAFNASSEADLSIVYPDAGLISLHARYDLDTGVAGFEMVGSSNAFVVRPFGLRLSGAGIPGVTGPGGGVFRKAGENFDVTVTAVNWQAADDADNDGAPDSGANLADNAATPNFGQETPAETVTVSRTLVAPAGGASGVLTGTLFSGFAGGARTNAMSWSEVGSITLDAVLTSANYLGAGGNALGSVSPVGRFIPDHFFLVPGATLTNRSALGCAPASAFTYLGEALGLSFTLQARNTANAVTQNYTTASGFAKLDPATTAQLGFGALSGATDLTPRIGSASASGSFVAGAASITASLAINRAVSPDGPFTATRIGIAPADSDAVVLRTADLDLDVDGAGGNDHQQTGSSTELRFGRLRLANAAGSSLLDLPLALETQYYNGVGFARNSADDCTVIPVQSLGMTNFGGQLAACETALQPAAGNLSFASGRASSLKLRGPGDGNQGSVDLNVNLDVPTVATTCTSIGASTAPTVSANLPFLRSDWGSGSFNQDPTARATFGVFKNADEFIFYRENF